MNRENDRKEMLDAVRMVRFRLGDGLTAEQFRRATGYSGRRVLELWGSWTELKEAAGIARERRRRISDEELLEEFGRVWQELGQPPSWNELDAWGKCAGSTFARRFGGKRQTIAAYQRHVARRQERARAGFEPTAAEVEKVRAAAWVRAMWEGLTVAFVVSGSEMRERPHGLCDLVVCLRDDWPGGAVQAVVMGELVERGLGGGG